jgi:hypothetical protein
MGFVERVRAVKGLEGVGGLYGRLRGAPAAAIEKE